MEYTVDMKNTSGFTIVELLLVVVVMGILSTIVVVTFTGVQKRAKDAQLISGIDSLEKGLRLYELKNGGFPNPTDVASSGGITAACVQPTSGGWPAEQGLTSSDCYFLSSNGARIGYSPVLRDALQTVVSEIPDTSAIVYSAPDILSARGIIYQYWTEDRVALAYFVPNDQTCGRAERRFNVGDLTQCVIELKGI